MNVWFLCGVLLFLETVIVKMLGGEWKISGSIFQFTTYSLRTISFHYSSNRTIGSEHRLEGKVYPLEVRETFLFTCIKCPRAVPKA